MSHIVPTLPLHSPIHSLNISARPSTANNPSNSSSSNNPLSDTIAIHNLLNQHETQNLIQSQGRSSITFLPLQSPNNNRANSPNNTGEPAASGREGQLSKALPLLAETARRQSQIAVQQEAQQRLLAQQSQHLRAQQENIEKTAAAAVKSVQQAIMLQNSVQATPELSPLGSARYSPQIPKNRSGSVTPGLSSLQLAFGFGSGSSSNAAPSPALSRPLVTGVTIPLLPIKNLSNFPQNPAELQQNLLTATNTPRLRENHSRTASFRRNNPVESAAQAISEQNSINTALENKATEQLLQIQQLQENFDENLLNSLSQSPSFHEGLANSTEIVNSHASNGQSAQIQAALQQIKLEKINSTQGERLEKAQEEKESLQKINEKLKEKLQLYKQTNSENIEKATQEIQQISVQLAQEKHKSHNFSTKLLSLEAVLADNITETAAKEYFHAELSRLNGEIGSLNSNLVEKDRIITKLHQQIKLFNGIYGERHRNSANYSEIEVKSEELERNLAENEVFRLSAELNQHKSLLEFYKNQLNQANYPQNKLIPAQNTAKSTTNRLDEEDLNSFQLGLLLSAANSHFSSKIVSKFWRNWRSALEKVEIKERQLQLAGKISDFHFSKTVFYSWRQCFAAKLAENQAKQTQLDQLLAFYSQEKARNCLETWRQWLQQRQQRSIRTEQAEIFLISKFFDAWKAKFIGIHVENDRIQLAEQQNHGFLMRKCFVALRNYTEKRKKVKKYREKLRDLQELRVIHQQKANFLAWKGYIQRKSLLFELFTEWKLSRNAQKTAQLFNSWFKLLYRTQIDRQKQFLQQQNRELERRAVEINLVKKENQKFSGLRKGIIDQEAAARAAELEKKRELIQLSASIQQQGAIQQQIHTEITQKINNFLVEEREKRREQAKLVKLGLEEQFELLHSLDFVLNQTNSAVMSAKFPSVQTSKQWIMQVIGKIRALVQKNSAATLSKSAKFPEPDSPTQQIAIEWPETSELQSLVNSINGQGESSDRGPLTVELLGEESKTQPPTHNSTKIPAKNRPTIRIFPSNLAPEEQSAQQVTRSSNSAGRRANLGYNWALEQQLAAAEKLEESLQSRVNSLAEREKKFQYSVVVSPLAGASISGQVAGNNPNNYNNSNNGPSNSGNIGSGELMSPTNLFSPRNESFAMTDNPLYNSKLFPVHLVSNNSLANSLTAASKEFQAEIEPEKSSNTAHTPQAKDPAAAKPAAKKPRSNNNSNNNPSSAMISPIPYAPVATAPPIIIKALVPAPIAPSAAVEAAPEDTPLSPQEQAILAIRNKMKKK
jgi:hypothetical protein